MERTRITFERAAARPGELVRGVVMMELQRDLRAKRFDVRAEGIERVAVVLSVGHIGGPAVQERRVFEIPLLLEMLHVPVGFGRGDDGLIVFPKGVYFLGFSFRVPQEGSHTYSEPLAATDLLVMVSLTDASGVEVETSAMLTGESARLESAPEPARRLALL
ncbi:MAG TPA: hypothetical protein VI893_09340 [Thermoplasmata archaeon]|nr:hypothetical protein [Thermoplasmata archaeon]